MRGGRGEGGAERFCGRGRGQKFGEWRVYWGAGEVGKILLLMHNFIQQVLILVYAQAKILLVALDFAEGRNRRKKKRQWSRLRIRFDLIIIWTVQSLLI